ncbi:MAG: TetR/AcrR family transcriptional regulator, partial [Mycobacterium sp.]|nr:TetR/AcrR family transcriptional regulator [Mycobacterium sp.]
SYLQHQMAKESEPQDKVARWIEGTLAQMTDPQLISKSRAAAQQMSAGVNWLTADQEMLRPLRDLLIAPVTELGGRDVDRDVEAVFCCTAATLRRYVHAAGRLGSDDITHVVGFCLRGLGVS